MKYLISKINIDEKGVWCPTAKVEDHILGNVMFMCFSTVKNAIKYYRELANRGHEVELLNDEFDTDTTDEFGRSQTIKLNLNKSLDKPNILII